MTGFLEWVYDDALKGASKPGKKDLRSSALWSFAGCARAVGMDGRWPSRL